MKKILQNKYVPGIILALFVIIGVALRIYFLSQPGYISDIHVQYQWYETIVQKGLWGLYAPNYYPWLDYPPIMPVIGSLWFRLYDNAIINHIEFYYFFKLLPTIFEVILLFIISRIIWLSKSKYKYLLMAITLIQPGLAIVTSAWGQCDSVVTLLIVLGLICIQREKYTLTTLIFFLALMTKPQSILILFVYLAVLIAKGQYKKLITQVLFFTSLILISAVIFGIFGDTNILSPFIGAIGRYTFLSGNALNLWWGIFGKDSIHIADTSNLQNIAFLRFFALNQIGLCLFAFFSLPGIIYLLNNHKKIEDLALVSGYLYLLFFTFPSQIHERYLYYAVALFAIAAIKGRKIILIYIVSTISLFLNCFSVLHEYYKDQYPAIAFSFLYTNYAIMLCWINVGMCIFLAAYFIRSINENNSTKLQ